MQRTWVGQTQEARSAEGCANEEKAGGHFEDCPPSGSTHTWAPLEKPRLVLVGKAEALAEEGVQPGEPPLDPQLGPRAAHKMAK